LQTTIDRMIRNENRKRGNRPEIQKKMMNMHLPTAWTGLNG